MARKAKSDPSIAASQLGPSTAIQPEGQPREQKQFDQWAHIGLAAKVAKSTTMYRNKRFNNCEKYFPHYPLMRTVDRFFPFAEINGKKVGLYIDEPENDVAVEQCKLKAKALQAEGLNYAYIAPGMGLQDVLAQLEARV